MTQCVHVWGILSGIPYFFSTGFLKKKLPKKSLAVLDFSSFFLTLQFINLLAYDSSIVQNKLVTCDL